MVLVTAFEPFGGDALNSSFEVLKALEAGPLINKFHSLLLPVSFSESWMQLSREINRRNPSAIVLLGQARGRDKVNLERVALNLIDCEIPDKQGNIIREQSISIDGPEAHFTRVSINGLIENLTGLPVKKSYSAGAYVCNFLYYKTLESLKDKSLSALFVHLPILPEQSIDGTCSLDLKTQVTVVEKIIELVSS